MSADPLILSSSEERASVKAINAAGRCDKAVRLQRHARPRRPLPALRRTEIKVGVLMVTMREAAQLQPAELPMRDRFGLRRLRHVAPEGVLCRECFTKGRRGLAELPSA